MRPSLFAMISIAFMMSGAAALAASQQDFQDCRDLPHNSDKGIAACSRIINDSGSNGSNLLPVGGGQFICCRAMFVDCEDKVIFSLRDIAGNAVSEQCVRTCLRDLKC